jgi:outer membrane protein assembly factor BamB
MGRRGIACALVAVLVGWWVAPARADWTTYHADAQRSGVDLSSVGSVPFSPAWSSQGLAGDVYAEPLVYKGLVFVATEGDEVYALSESTGAVVWHASACAGGMSGCAPVPSGQLPCGDISPTVGITSTPVIDPATKRLFVVAETWDGSHPSSIEHRLVGFNVADGSLVRGSPMVVDAPGSTPAAQLQRAALALDGGEVLIGYGGNYGDCGSYHGWLIGAPETAGSRRSSEVEQQSPLLSFEVEKNSHGGAIWGAGNGPAIDSSGSVWATSGNGFGSTYQYQESVLKLDSSLNLLDHWAPSNWSQLDISDADLGSSEPLLLPGGLVFQIGKGGVGYLLSASDLGGTGASPRFQAQVCDQTGHASYGGGVYYAGVLYVACSDGLRALSLDTFTSSLTPLPGWQVTSAAIGPPIIAGGLVWATGWNTGTLYGLDPQTGHPTVTQPTPAMEHFTSPAASDGKLFLATGQTVQAYTIANPAPANPRRQVASSPTSP